MADAGDLKSSAARRAGSSPASGTKKEIDMGMSERRRKLRSEKKTRKVAQMKSPGFDSKYARKLRGIYPPNSPYVTGNWGKRMRKLGEEKYVGIPQSTPLYGW